MSGTEPEHTVHAARYGYVKLMISLPDQINAMQTPPFESILQENPTLELLRAHQAPLILGFLWHAFQGEVLRSQAWMQQQLADYLERRASEDEDVEARAKQYLDSWCERKFLRNFMDDERKEIQYVLTRHSEKAFQVIELLQTREFVGTESRFQDIFTKLRDIAREGQQNAQDRLHELKTQRKALDVRIEQLERGAQLPSLEEYQIRSRYEDVVRMIHELRGDFREVEDNFRQLTRRIYARHAEGSQSGGKLLGYAFDALDELRESDQGKSFYNFWRFLNDETLNDELQRLIQSVHGILRERELPFAEQDLRYLKRSLFNAGYQVVMSNEQLAQKLAQIVSEQDIAARQRSLELTRAIRQRALELIGQEPDKLGLEVEVLTPPYLPLERPLQLALRQPAFASGEISQGPAELELAEISQFLNPWLVDKQALRQRLELALLESSQVSLPELLTRYPLEKGLPELLAWISLSQSEPHHFDRACSDCIPFQAEPPRSLRLPHLIFTKGPL